MEWTNELVLPGGDVAASDRAQGSIFLVGNATVILSYAGFTILTNPNFLHRGDHVHLGHGMTAARRTDPALELEALPPIDFVLLSHMHEDHFDREVERKLDHSLPIVTTPHAAADLTSKGFRAAKALNTWEPLTVTKGGALVRVRLTDADEPDRCLLHGPDGARLRPASRSSSAATCSARPAATAYLEAGGTLENAQAMAAHESPRTTKLYDRTGGEITLDEVERITI